MRIKQLREDEKGSGLVLTLMVLLVLSVLGIAIGTLAIGSYRLSNVTRDDTSAYYIAEAGAVAAYEEVQKKVLNAYKNDKTEGAFYNQVSDILTSKNGNSSADFEIQFGSKPSAIIRTEKVDAQNYAIHSTGEVDGKERTVTKPITVNWVEKNTGGGGLPEIPDNAVLLTKGKIDIDDGTFTGDIHTNSVEKGAIEISGGPIFKNTKLYHPSTIDGESLIDRENNGKWIKEHIVREKPIDFGMYENILKQTKLPNITKKLPIKQVGTHEVQDKDGNLSITDWQAKGYELKLESDVYIPKIESNSNRNFTINTGKSDLTILVNDLNLSGDVSIKGEGALTIIIKKSFTIKGAGTFNINKNSRKPTLVYFGDDDFDLENGSKINGHVIIKEADLNVSTGASINGVVLTGGDEVELIGGSQENNMMLIAPFAEVELDSGFYLHGTVIAETFEMDGGAKLIYAPIDTTDFPFGSSGTTTDPNPEDIISSGIIKED